MVEESKSKALSVGVGKEGVSLAGFHSRSVSHSSTGSVLLAEGSRFSFSLIKQIFKKRTNLKSKVEKAEAEVSILKNKIGKMEDTIENMKEDIKKAKTPKAQEKIKTRVTKTERLLKSLKRDLATKQEDVERLKRDLEKEREEERERWSWIAPDNLPQSYSAIVKSQLEATNPEFADMNDFKGIIDVA